MMDSLIERYVYDVVRRLPEKDREEVTQELQSNIYDMLSEEATEEILKEVLNELGDPMLLANQYRQSPSYIISPAVYNEYMRALKWIVPLVSTIFLCIGLFVGTFNAMDITNGFVDLNQLFTVIIPRGITYGFNGVVQALFWTTIGFVVADRKDFYKNKGSQYMSWVVDNLPELPKKKEHAIPLADIIAGLVMTTFVATFIILACSNIFSIGIFDNNMIMVDEIFDASFVRVCIPIVILIIIAAVVEYTCKFIDRSWTFLVSISTIISDVVTMFGLIYLLSRPVIFSEQVINYIRNAEWISNRFINSSSYILILVTIVITCFSCGYTIYKMQQLRKVIS